MIISEIGDLKLFVLMHDSSNYGRSSPFSNIYGSPLPITVSKIHE
jgi:hypothetical protein